MGSYQNIIEADHPIVFKTFDDATNKTHPLVAGLGTAALITTSAFTHTFDQWNQMPFTAEVWFKPLNNNTITIIGHDDDGLIYDPTNNLIVWTIKQSDGTFVSTSQSALNKTMYLVAQYTGYSIVLYVNGVSSSEFTTLPITSTGALRTGAGKMSVDALALYDYLLSDSKMEYHFYQGIDFPTLGSVYANAENYFELSDQQENLLLNVDFSDWSSGYLDGSVINSDGNLVNDVGVDAGYYYVNLILPDDLVLQGAKIAYEYIGTAPVAEWTTDGTTWTVVNNNNVLGAVPVGAAMGPVDPMIRLTLKAGTVLTSLKVVVYQDNKSIGLKDTNYLSLTRPAVSSFEQMYPYEQDTYGGANIAGGSLKLVKNNDDTIAGISYWYFGDEPTGGTKNGGLGHISNQWNFYYNNVTTLNITNYTGRISNVATWSTQQVASVLYGKHFAKPTLSVIDSDKITVTEPNDGVVVSQKNWIMI